MIASITRKTRTNRIAACYMCCLMTLTACATTPSRHFANMALNSGFSGFSLNSGLFDHQFYLNAESRQHPNGILHVYLDGDGSPWEQHRWIADDPTARNTMILTLMQQDKNPAIFLGRPCYHGFNKSPPCRSKYWTSHRYSSEVVNSMALALKQWLKNNPYRQLVLIGFSGGGTLAVLIAPMIHETQTIVTVAANLDIEAWSSYHRYQPLTGSLNPAKLVLNAKLQQIHLAGLEDITVPAGLIKAYADKQVHATYIAYPDFNHHCCWIKEWPSILSLIK